MFVLKKRKFVKNVCKKRKFAQNRHLKYIMINFPPVNLAIMANSLLETNSSCVNCPNLAIWETLNLQNLSILDYSSNRFSNLRSR